MKNLWAGYSQSMNRKSRLLLIPAIAATLLFAGCSTTPTVSEPEPVAEESAEEAEPAAEETPEPEEVGSRSNPASIGSAVTDGDWSVTIDSVNLAANDIMTANEFNELPAEGNVYILVTGTVTYNGTEDAGENYYGIIDYVTADGNTISQSYVDTSGSGIPDYTIMDPLYPGASHTGALAFEVPAATAGEGTLAVTVDMMTSERKFVKVQ
ncbi:DUF4352 domain-containing protein [Leucobacter sp. NPDC077196]|uniref:DUF4352 domain-containing protein n=1 Tax=Leucobacter sp. NPDC077196 TaxID=3154959 RepID=UPI0034220CE4